MSRWGGFILVLISCWGGTGWNCDSSLLNTKMSRLQSNSPKIPEDPQAPRCDVSSEKKLKFSGHSCFLHPETLGKWSNFWGAYFSKGNLKSPTSFVHVFLRGNTRGKKSSLLKSVFKGDQVMAVQQQRQGPNGCGVLVATKLVLGVMYL